MPDFPVVNGSASSQEDTAVTTHTVALPAGIVAGELLLVFVAVDGIAVTAWSSGWFLFRDVFSLGPNSRLVTLLRYADGTEGSSITVTTASAIKSEHVSVRIGCTERLACPQFAFANQNAGSNFSSPLLEPAGWGTEGVMWITVIVLDGGIQISAFPANYVDNQYNVFTTGAGSSSLGIATRELNAASEDPPAFTHSTSNAVAATFGIRPVQTKPCPSFVNKGLKGAHTFSHNDYTLPEGTIPGDLMVLLVETNTGTLTVPTGWTEFPDSPQGSGGTQLSAYYRRFVSGDTPQTVTAIDHATAQVASFRGVVASGNPYDVTAGGVDATSDTSGSVPGDTTTVDGCLVLAICSTGFDVQTDDQFSGWTNADLANVEEIMDFEGAAGNGGGAGVAIGEKTNSGAYGATDVTLANASEKGMMSIALKPDTTLVSPDCERLLFGQIIRHH